MTVPPAAIQQLNQTLAARTDCPSSYTFDGIVGDSQHSFGYHLSPNQLRANGEPGDYSLTLSRDVAGAAAHPEEASAWDLGFGPADMVTVTNRLLIAARAHDPRMRAVREFCGTTDGQHTHPYDLSNDQDGPLDSWDNSHLWHVHISFYRDVCNDFAALSPVLDVLCGHVTTPPAPLEEEDMKIVTNASRVQFLLLLGAGPKPLVLRDAALVAAYVAAGVTSKAISDANYSKLRSVS